ncbi:unnamed protein product [Dibothriocephalus latus]|uniref:Uncharacterized protein n=1 Tax=Dibothriocephalus latus TaxID=60516 RepID=A0A3P6QTC2_DIBLA|nr:unnamed protein product [Dibothriocephalus latus]
MDDPTTMTVNTSVSHKSQPTLLSDDEEEEDRDAAEQRPGSVVPGSEYVTKLTSSAVSSPDLGVLVSLLVTSIGMFKR